MKRHKLGNSKRWVIKIGSSLLTDEGRGLDTLAINTWVEQIARLRDHGKEIILVSSGAVAEGMARLGWRQRPRAINELQAAAAIGQMGLIQAYESCFKLHKLHTAQILLTHDDLASRERYINARTTLKTLLKLGAIPIINENDTVATDEIRFGDNDTLGALVANLVEADLLIILTDQDGLFTADPRTNPNAELVFEGMASNPDFIKMAGGSGSHLGRGGMSTKITAAQRAARSGAATLITSGRAERVLLRIARGEELGTLLLPDKGPMAARKQWLASHLKVAGYLHLDEGAVTVLKNSGKSLLAVGVTAVTGDFARGEMVSCLAPDGTEIARGLVNYDALESAKILGKPTSDIESLLGYIDEPELIHRDNLVLL